MRSLDLGGVQGCLAHKKTCPPRAPTVRLAQGPMGGWLFVKSEELLKVGTAPRETSQSRVSCFRPGFEDVLYVQRYLTEKTTAP